MAGVERDILFLSRHSQGNIEALLTPGPVSSDGEKLDGRFDPFGRFWVRHDGFPHCFWHPELLGLSPDEWVISLEGLSKPRFLVPLFNLVYKPTPLCLWHRENCAHWALDLADIRQVDTKHSGIMRVGQSSYLLRDDDTEDLDRILQGANQGFTPGISLERTFVKVLEPKYLGVDLMVLMFYLYLSLDEKTIIYYDAAVIDLGTKELLSRRLERPLTFQ